MTDRKSRVLDVLRGNVDLSQVTGYVALALFAGTLVLLAWHSLGEQWRLDRVSAQGIVERWRSLRDDEEVRIRRALANRYIYYETLSRNTPVEASIAVLVPVNRGGTEFQRELRNMVFPRQVDFIHTVSELETASFVLNLFPEERFLSQGSFEVIDSHERYSLWRLRDRRLER